jgi:Secretion system C-terminal sorting domain/PKD-like domain
MRKIIPIALFIIFGFKSTFGFGQCSSPAAAGAIIGFSFVCETQTGVPFSIGAIKDASTYVWTYSGTGVTMSGDTTTYMLMDFSSTATSGLLTVKGKNACGDGISSASYSVTVNPLPDTAGTITGTSTVCQGTTTVFYSVPIVANSNNYLWEYSGTGAIISGSTNSITIDFLPTATSGILTVKGGNDCTTGAPSPNFPITVNLVPQGSFTGNSICTGDTRKGQLTWMASSGPGPYTIVYNDGTANRTKSNVISGVPFNSFSKPTSTTTYTLVSVTSNNCSRSNGFDKDTATITVSSQVASFTTNPSDTAICEGLSTAFQVEAIGAYAYKWQVSTDGGTNYSPISSAGTNPTYSNYLTAILSLSNTSITNNGYKYKCFITASCGTDITSAPATLTINPIPAAADTIVGLSPVCQKQNNVLYTVPSINNATNYIWSFSGNGATLSVTSNTVSINFSSLSGSGYLSVKGATAFCTGKTSADLPISVTLSPTSAGLITGTHTVCQGQTAVAYKIPIFHNHSSYDIPTFTWIYSGTGATISGNTNPMTIDFSPSATSGVLTVMRTQACGYGQVSPNYTITVNPTPDAPGILNDTAGCFYTMPTSFTYSINPIPNAAKYIWTNSGNCTMVSDSSTSILLNRNGDEIFAKLTVQGINGTCRSPVSDTIMVSIGYCISGIEENTLSQNASIFPNPTTGIFNISIKDVQFSSLSISICDVLGKQVYATSDKNNSGNYNKQINLEGIAKGIYYAKLRMDDYQKTYKISIQ